MPDPTTDAALLLVNQLHTSVATTARAVVTALADKKITAFESMQIAMDGMQLGASVLLAIQATTPEVRQAVLRVLEQGHWTLDT